MNKQSLAKFVQSTKMTLSKHSPEILTGIGITGMLTTTVLAVQATPKALRLIEDAQDEKGEELTVPETVKVCWKCYIPSAVSGTFSIACLIGASSVNARRNAALATAYKLSETAFTEYREKVVETIGEKKEKTVREKVDKKHIEKNPVSKNEVIVTKKGDTLCYDTISSRYFKSDIDKIKRVVNELNKEMLQDMSGCISVNELYDELGLDHTIVGDELGWNLDGGLIDIDFTSHIADDGTPCLVLNYYPAPKYKYDKYL